MTNYISAFKNLENKIKSHFSMVLQICSVSDGSIVCDDYWLTFDCKMITIPYLCSYIPRENMRTGIYFRGWHFWMAISIIIINFVVSEA